MDISLALRALYLPISKSSCKFSLKIMDFICGKEIWDKVFKNGPSKICGKQSFKNLKGYGLLKQTISLHFF